jgi:ABC-type transport system involved in multi-copper enzyme maturation permease subunit
MFSSMKRIAAIASNTYREAVRARILLGLAALALATALYSIAVGEYALKNAPRVVADLGAASISIYAIVVAVVIGATSLYRELEQKTIFPILARPILRAEYLVGKYAGTLLTLAVFMALDASVVLFILARHGGAGFGTIGGVVGVLVLGFALAFWLLPRWRTYLPIPWAAVSLAIAAALAAGAVDDRRVVLGATALAFCEVMIVSGIATLFSAFTSPFLTGVFTFGVFLVGREADTLGHLPARLFGDAFKLFGAGLSKIVPNLQLYVPPRPLLTGETPGTSLYSYIGLALVQAVAWSVGLLVVANWIFKRRDLL